MANIFPFALFSGDPIPVNLIFYDLVTDPSGNTVLNLTGSTVGLTVKVNATDPDADAVYTDDITGDTTGKINFSIPAPEPGNYVCDVKWWNSSNVRNNILQEAFTVNQSVTQREVPGAVPSFSITSINPISAAVGFSETLDVYGGIFSATTAVKFNAVVLPTTFIDAGHVSCLVTPVSGANAVIAIDGAKQSNSMTLTGT